MNGNENESGRERTPLERYLAKQRQAASPHSVDPTPEADAASSSVNDRNAAASTPDPEAIFSAIPHEPPKDRMDARGEYVQPPFEPTREPSVEVRPGGFASRLLGYAIDSFLVWGLTASVYRIFGGVFDLLTFYTFGGGMFLSLQLVTFLYYGWFYTEKGATPGKMAVGLEIRQYETHGRIGYVRAYFRESVGKYLSWLPLGLGFILPLFNRENRALHDLIFDTRIIRSSKG